MYKLLVLSSAVEGDLSSFEDQISYLKKFGLSITMLIDPSELELVRSLEDNEYDCAYIHIKRRFIIDCENHYDPAKVLEQKNVPTLGNSYITQLLIADKYTISKKSGIGLPNWIISRVEFNSNCFNWNSIDIYPVIVKPNSLHASMGISEDSIVYNKEKLKLAVNKLFSEFEFLNEVLIEKYAANSQEYTVSVLGNGDSLACSISKLEFKKGSVRINSKIQKELPLSHRSFELTIEENDKIHKRLEYHAKTLFHHFGMKDIARFDFVLDKSYYLLEANACPIPGNSFSWEWQNKYGLNKHQVTALYLCAFHFGQIASGKPSRLPLSLIEDLPKELINKIDNPCAVDVSPECSGPTDNCVQPHLFSMNDRVSSETEVHTFLKSLTQLIKPRFILETGTYKGSSTIAFADGLRQNKCGKMVTLEINESLAKQAQKMFSEYSVQVLNIHSLNYVPDMPIDLLFLDSKRDIRGQEFEHFLPYLCKKTIIVWHDSSYREQSHSVFDIVEELYANKIIDRILLPTPRGLTLSMLRS